MHATKSTIMALAPFLLGFASAAPAAGGFPEGRILADLDHDGKLEWTELDGNARFSHVPPELMREYETKRNLLKRDNIGDVEGKPTDVECQGSGKVMATNIIKDVSKNACTQLIANSQAGQALDGGYNVLHQFGVVDQADRQADLWFGWKWQSSSSTDGLTKSLCEELTEKMFEGAPCGENGETRGAKAFWNGAIEFVVDPWKGA